MNLNLGGLGSTARLFGARAAGARIGGVASRLGMEARGFARSASYAMDTRAAGLSMGGHRLAAGLGAAGTMYGGYRSVRNAQDGHYGKAAAWGVAAGLMGRRTASNMGIMSNMTGRRMRGLGM